MFEFIESIILFFSGFINAHGYPQDAGIQARLLVILPIIYFIGYLINKMRRKLLKSLKKDK